MSYKRICEMIGVTLTFEQEWACRYLEMHGYRFCENFGYQNAMQLATEHFQRNGWIA